MERDSEPDRERESDRGRAERVEARDGFGIFGRAERAEVRGGVGCFGKPREDVKEDKDPLLLRFCALR